MARTMELLYTFPNTHAAISGEQALLGAGIPVRVMPVPNAITAGCGLCLRVASEHRERCDAVMRERAIAVAAIYRIEGGGYSPVSGS